MLDRDQLRMAFCKFAGKEVAVDEVPSTRRHLKWDVHWTETKLAEPNPVVDEIKAMAAELGFTLRFWLPSTTATPTYSDTRLNVHVVKGQDGKYRIANQFTLG